MHRSRMGLRGYRRALLVLAAGGALYVVAFALMLPRQDPMLPVDAVMVLSSGVRADGTLDRDGAARFRRGIEVAKATGAPLYVSRVRRSEEPLVQSDAGQKRLADSSGLSNWKILDGIAVSTRDEAERLLAVRRGGTLAVVTSRLHTRRACAAFEKLGFDVVCIPAGFERPLWLQPYFVAYESAAILKYRFREWM